MPVNEHGAVEGALNPHNEGLTVREAMTREVMDIYRQLTRLRNVYLASENSAYARLNAAIGSGDRTGAMEALGALFTELAERHRKNTLVLTLRDCGAAPDMSNLDGLLLGVFGDDARAARGNIDAALSVWSAADSAFDAEGISALALRFEPLAAAIEQAALGADNVAGV